MNNKINVPNDIKKYVRKNIIKRVVFCIFLFLVFLLFIVFWGERCFHRMEGAKYGIYTVLLVLPIFISKPYKLIDSSWQGTIENIEIKYVTDSTRAFKPSLETLYTKEVIIFHIRLDNGKMISRKIFENRANPHNSSKLYKKGDRVVHIYGTKYIQIYNCHDKKICFVCGTSNPHTNQKCISCGYTVKLND